MKTEQQTDPFVECLRINQVLLNGLETIRLLLQQEGNCQKKEINDIISATLNKVTSPS